MLSQEAQLIALVSNEKLPETADAIVCLEGDENYIRADKALELFKKKLSSFIVVLGRKEVVHYLAKKGVDEKQIIFIEGPQKRNTRTEAEEVMEEIKKRGWKNIILITSFFHQPRAFLTFLGVAKKAGLSDTVGIFNAPANHRWFHSVEDISRWDRFMGISQEGEFNKIAEYRRKGEPLADVQEALEYQQWKEQLL